MENNFQNEKYIICKKFFKLVGASFKIFDTNNNLCFFVKQKAFKLREDIRVFSDESMSEELLLIKARKIVDFSSAYDVIDLKTNEKVGAFKRKGFKSMIKDEWIILDKLDKEIGIIKEDSMLMALLRRFIFGSLMPQSFDASVSGTKVFSLTQKFNLFLLQMVLDFSADSSNLLDKRMGICAGILLGAIEGKQN